MSKIPVLERTADVEIDQLKARVMELEEELTLAVGMIREVCDTCNVGWPMATLNRAENALNRTPAQSLEAHDREVAAKALEDGVNELRKRADLRNYDYQTNSIRSMLDAELMKIAARIREGE